MMPNKTPFVKFLIANNLKNFDQHENGKVG